MKQICENTLLMKPPVKPDDIPNPPEGFTYAGVGKITPIDGNFISSEDISMLNIGAWESPAFGNGVVTRYAVRTDSTIHRAQAWYVDERFERMKELMQLNPEFTPWINRLALFKDEELEAELERRRKPKTITINGIEVPEPHRGEIPNHTPYYMPYLAEYISCPWHNDLFDKKRMAAGLIHLTKEAAIKHAEALISFTKLP